MIIEKGWQKALSAELSSDYFLQMMDFLEKERKAGKEIFPAQKDIFTAFELTPFDSVKVVILGQDPYHGPGQAHGLAFSVLPEYKTPPSLKNIYKELSLDLNIELAFNGYLSAWAEQGVLLLNTILSVEKTRPLSHSKIGWKRFTQAVIQSLIQSRQPIVFLLWGALAQEKYRQSNVELDDSHLLLLRAPHPSPLSVHQGFLGCRHFSQTNQYLIKNKIKPIDWDLKSASLKKVIT